MYVPPCSNQGTFFIINLANVEHIALRISNPDTIHGPRSNKAPGDARKLLDASFARISASTSVLSAWWVLPGGRPTLLLGLTAAGPRRLDELGLRPDAARTGVGERA